MIIVVPLWLCNHRLQTQDFYDPNHEEDNETLLKCQSNISHSIKIVTLNSTIIVHLIKTIQFV